MVYKVGELHCVCTEANSPLVLEGGRCVISAAKHFLFDESSLQKGPGLLLVWSLHVGSPCVLPVCLGLGPETCPLGLMATPDCA